MIVQISTHAAIHQANISERTGVAFKSSDNETIVWWIIRPGSLYREVPGEEGVQIR